MSPAQPIKVQLKLYASLAEYLPQKEKKHSVDVTITPNDTPNQIMKRFNIPCEKVHLVLLNGVYLEPADRDRGVFRDGDVLALWPPVAGG